MEKIPADIKNEIEKLVKELNEHNYRYYVLDAPVISDEEYDRMFRRLKELEEKNIYVLPDSPTQRVGAPPLDKFEKVRHTEPMLSLDNAFSHDEVREFDQRVKRFLKSDREVEYTVEPKYDGLAMELTYKNGVLDHASTRGDGIEGEDVTRTSHPKVLKLIGDGKMPPEWARRLDRLAELARRGDSPGVIRELDVLVSGYRPDYAFHGGAEPAPAAEEQEPLPLLQPRPPSKSVH